MVDQGVVALCVLGVCCAPSGVAAQDMVFTQDPTEPAAGLPPPSATLVRALKAYSLGKHAEAAVQLQHVVEGSTGDGPQQVHRAQFALAKSLVHLGYDVSALVLFDAVAQSRGDHPYFVETLPWLAELGGRMPVAAPVALAVGNYRATHLDSLSGPDADATRAQLQYLMGRQAYADAELETAIAHLAEVPPSSPRYLQALFMVGAANVRARRSRPAVASFRTIVEAVDEDERWPDSAAMRDLAWLSLGRVYYTAAMQKQGSAEGGRLLGNAVDAFSRVGTGSDHWLDALFESAWALFVSDQQARSLGNLHALLSPFFPGAFYPEAYVLKAVTFYQACQLDNAFAMVGSFHRRYDKLLQELNRTGTSLDIDGAVELVQAARKHRLQTSRPLAAVLERALSDREVSRQLARLAHVDERQAALRRATPAFGRSSLAARLGEDLLVEEGLARAELGTIVKGRVTRLADELQDLANRMDAVEIEVYRTRRGELAQGGAGERRPSPAGGVVHVDSEHVLWPFNGEYWRDELGYYRQQVTHHCQR